MAVSTTTSVVQIVVTDEGGRTKSFNIDEPRENLSLSQIKSAIQPAINGRWWIGPSDTPIIALKSANYSTSQKIPIEGSDAVITVTPSSINTAGTTASVTVEGSTLVGAYLSNFSDILDSDHFYTTLTFGDEQVVEIASTLSNPSGTMTLNIVTESKTVQVPVTFT